MTNQNTGRKYNEIGVAWKKLQAERKANEQLVLCASDLLAACELALASFEGVRPSNHYAASQREFDTLTAVINRAKGAQ